MEDSERGAIERARAGDGEAFRLLVERHSRTVFRLAYRMTGNETDAEDVVQESFLRAYRTLDRFEDRSSFGTWLHRIAANYALDLLRARKRVRSLEACEESEEREMSMAAVVASSDPGPDRRTYSGQVRERVDATLAKLTDQERSAFLLRHYDGRSIEEIGEVLGIGESATKNSIFRAVQKLRRALEPMVGPVR